MTISSFFSNNERVSWGDVVWALLCFQHKSPMFCSSLLPMLPRMLAPKFSVFSSFISNLWPIRKTSVWLARLFFANIVWWWLLVTITRLFSANMSNWIIGDRLFFVPFLCSIGSQIIARCGEFNGSATSIRVDGYELGLWINLGFWLFWVMVF